ncbi:MAG: acyltransferase [Bacteroidia bacterium]
MNKIYFPNLNGLRFIAALLVIIHHVEQIKNIFGVKNFWENSTIQVIGKLGVILFFVLSGFLITYLLLEERRETKTISIKDFYIRRILRIWPLYFLIIILGFFILPKISFFHLGNLSKLVTVDLAVKFCLFVFFLPNVALAMFSPVPFAAQAWSVGIEEQFYLIWPLLMKYIKQKQIFFYIIIIGYIFMNIFGFNFVKTHLFYDDVIDTVAGIWSGFSIDCMAIGGLFALYLHEKNTAINFLFKNYVQWFTIILLVILISVGLKIPYVHYEVYAILFGIVIINLAANPKSVLNLENNFFIYLGKISYGLYMFHPIAIFISIKLLLLLNLNFIGLQYILSISLAIFISACSYKYFEKYFIMMKIKYSQILSGDNV